MKANSDVLRELTEYGDIVRGNIGLLNGIEPDLEPYYDEILAAVRSDALRIFALACAYEPKLTKPKPSPPSAR